VPDILPLRRYLTRFDTLDLPQHTTDILVLGSGIAGLTAALEAQRFGRVLCVTKAALNESNTRYAQGGIAVALADDDRVEDHIRDTLVAGAGLCDERVVEVCLTEGRDAVRHLIEIGTGFDRAPAGELLQTLEGGHGRPRVIHADGDSTGKAVQLALATAAKACPRIRTKPHTFAIDLLTSGKGCVGALVWDPAHGPQVVWARATILATGGAGGVFRETTNPAVATGDGLAMALRAGCELMDMELMQFHPTTLYIAGAARALISEAVRGEGAVLRDVEGDRFMDKVHPLRDLAPRDIVARAIVRAMRRTQTSHVLLDATGIAPALFRRRFPWIGALCASFGIDPQTDPIPVRPTAHYFMGGVRTDLDARTSLAQLYACGECAATGLHGANRLASNSLLEGAVFGRRAGEAAGRSLAGLAPIPHPAAIAHAYDEAEPDIPLDVRDVRAALRSAMGRLVGVERNAAGLSEAVRRIRRWGRYVLDRELKDPAGWELQNLLTTALAISRQALLREESRGAHYRTDHPATDDDRWRRHLRLVRDDLLAG